MADNDDDLRAELERLRAENEALKEGAKKGLRLQVSAKGGASLDGSRRFPIFGGTITSTRNFSRSCSAILAISF